MIHKQRLNNRILSLVLALVMVLGMLPVTGLTAFAASASATPVIKEADRYVAGFGTPIYIEAGTTEGYTVVWYDKNGTKTYLTANGDSGQDLSGYTVYGGAPAWNATYYQNTEWDFVWNTITATSITMTGGTLTEIVANSYRNYESSATLRITGGTVGSINFGNKLSFDDTTSTGLVLIDTKVGNSITIFTGIYRSDDTYIARGAAEIPSDFTLTVSAGETLSVPQGTSLTNNGTIVNNGTIMVDGALINNGTINGSGTITRNAAYITTGSSGTPSLWVDGSAVTDFTTEYVDGKLYIYKVTGNIKATLNGTDYYYGVQKSGSSTELTADYISTTGISGIPAEIVANKPVTLDAVLSPELTTFATTVSYSLENAGDTGAELNGNILTAYKPGTVELKVTATDGYSSYSEDFNITVKHVPVTGLSGEVPSAMILNAKITLPTAIPSDASYTDIEWSFVSGQSETGASIANGVLTATKEGSLTVRATIKNGADYGTDYTKDFTVKVSAVSDMIDISTGSVTISEQDGKLRVTYSGFSGGYKDYATDDMIVITGETTTNTVTVESGSPYVVLSNCSITISTAVSPFSIASGAKVNLILNGSNVLKNTKTDYASAAGLSVPQGAEVDISGDGSLEAAGGSRGAGIGGGDEGAGGTVTITGGTVTATGGYGAAGIGGGRNGAGGTITITGGTVTATGGDEGAGIGGGYREAGGTVTITGGTVTATGGSFGAGIGGGNKEAGGTVTITGGTVTATGGDNGAGIGGGNEGAGGTITITGGTVTATGGAGSSTVFGGAGIGGGKNGSGGNITITGGTVTANGRAGGAGIGGGYNRDGGNVTITGGSIKATADGTRAEAIGKGDYGSSSGTLTNGAINGDKSLDLVTITLAGVSGEVTVDSIDVPAYYGMNDVVTMDEGKLYLYLPADSVPATITLADGTVYKDYDNDLTFVEECESHTYTVTFSWADDYSAATYEAECGVCAYHFLGNATVTSRFDGAENCQEKDTTTFTASCELGGTNYSEDKIAYGSVGAHAMNGKGYCDACDMAFDSDNDGYYEIWTPGHLNWFAQQVNGGEKTMNGKLMSDIDLENKAWKIICETGLYYSGYGTDYGYAGVFDGNGHVIKNVTVTSSATMNASCGLFGTVSGTIKNLGVENFTLIDGGKDIRAGAIVGQLITANGRVSNCYVVNATINPGDHVTGGIAGCVYDGTIENCYVVKSTISGAANRFGYIVGDSCADGNNGDGTDRPGTVKNCYTDGSVAYSTRTGKVEDCVSGVSAETFASGEITYKLNGDQSSIVWYQTLETDAYPQFTGSVVYYDSVNGYNNHIHNWTYTKDGNKITATCDATGCTNNDGGSVTIAKPASLTYTGEAIEAVVTNLLTTGDAVTVQYTGNTTDGYPVNAGSYTASVTVVGGPSVSVDFMIEAATITGATVTVDSNADLTYTGSAITPAVTVTLDDNTLNEGVDYTVGYTNNTNAGTATITITGKGNYQGTATATFTIEDKTKPTGEILIKNNGWREFLNTITFGIFFKDYVDVTVTADGTGSGVAKVEYLLSGTALDENNLPTEGWTELTANDGKYSFSIKPQNKAAVYVRITDEYNNVTVINSDGIVVYQDSVAKDTEVTYIYQENCNMAIAVTFNGNTVKSIVCGEATLVAGTDYTVDYDNGKIVLNAAYLNTLNASDTAYIFTVSYDPMGIADSGVTDLSDTTFAVKVNKAQISTVTVDVTAPEAGAAKQTDVAGSTGYSAAISWNCDTEKFGYNTAYTATVTLTADSNHKFTSDLTSSGWNVVVSADGTTATLTKIFDTTRKEKLTAISAPTYSTLNKYYTDVADAIKELPTTVAYTTESGNVTVNIEWACSNYDYAVTKTNIFTWKVKDGELTNYDENNIATTGEIIVTNASAISVENSGENKTVTYSGSTYDVAGMFTIDKNAGEASYAIIGGTGAGTLNGSVLTITKAGTIEIKLTTAANGAYAAGEATATLTVNKGAGSGTVTIEGWTYGEDANAPVVNSSTNGTAGVTYRYESTDGKGYNGSVAPENAGSYKLTVTFAETDLYEACTDDATFTIEQKELTPAITGSISKAYDGTTTVPDGLSIALDGIIGTDDVTATASFAYDGVNVGTTKVSATGIILSGADAGNYKLTATTASANVGTITQATPAYTVPTGLTATYGDTLADVTLPEGFAWEAALTTAVGNVGNGEFTVTYTPGDTLNYKTVTGIVVSIEVKAAAASVATAPIAISGLIYNKTAQALITAGTANGGELQYSLSKDSGYSTTIPTGTGAGTYTVWYKVVGDSNHSDTAPVSIEVKIGKADPAIGAVTAGVVNDTLDISAIALNRADTTVDGVLTVDAGQKLKLGDNEIAYTFTPADTDNYERVTGKVTVTVKDTIAPTGKVTLGTNSWNEFLNNITFGLFFKETQTVSVEASDSFSGVEKIEYYATGDVLDLDGVKALADDKWTVMDGSVSVTAEDAKQFIYYIRITDKSGNIGYLATNGAEFDTTAPVIDGVHNGVTYYTTQKVTVTDKNLDTVTLNGEAVTGTITLDGNKEATYIIVATDKAGNATTVTVTMKLTESVGAPLDGITEDNVTSEDKDTIQDVIDQVEDLLDDEDLTEEEKAALEEIKEEAEKLIEKIEEVTGATDTENTEKVEDITPENVKPEDKTDLEKAKEDLEDALENNGDNYTEDEKKAIQEEIDRIDEALDVIDRVEKVEQQIENLPDTITKSDEAAVKAAEEAYNALTDYEKSLVSKDSKKALDDAVAALAELNKPQTPPTGDSFNFGLWTSVMVVSAIALAVLLIEQKKRKTSK